MWLLGDLTITADQQYLSHMSVLASVRPHINPQRVGAGFSHLIVEPGMLDQLGPAIDSGRAVFLYGPPGNGKSVMGDGIGRVLGGDIYVPHAIDVDGQIIALFDPVTHQAREREIDRLDCRQRCTGDPAPARTSICAKYTGPMDPVPLHR